MSSPRRPHALRCHHHRCRSSRCGRSRSSGSRLHGVSSVPSTFCAIRRWCHTGSTRAEVVQRQETDTRGPRRVVLGTACSQSRCAAPPITMRSPDPGRRSMEVPPPLRAHQERAPSAERDDRDDRVVEFAEFAIGVPRHAVSAVAVVVDPRSTQRVPVGALECIAASTRGSGRRVHRRRAPSTTDADRRARGPTFCDDRSATARGR